jgi:hypothetical protein
MLRHIFYALLGGYFVAGVLIGLNLLTADDWGRREPTTGGSAPVQGTRTPGAESADVTDDIIEQALTSQRKGGDNGEVSLSPPPVAVLQSAQPDRRTGRGPGNDTGIVGLRPPQSSEPQSLQARQVSPTVRAINKASSPHPQTDQTASLSPSPVAVLQSPHPDRRTAGDPGNDTGIVGLGHPQSSEPQSLQARQVASRSSPTVRAINQASIPRPRTDQTGSTSIPQTLEAAQVDTGALPTVTAPSRAQQGRQLLEAKHKPVELLNRSIFGPSFGGTADPAPTMLGNESDGKSFEDSDLIPPKAIRKVFTLACSLLPPAIAAGKLSTGQGTEIGRMQDDYLKKAECLVAAKRATKIAKRKIGCRCTAETKELDAAAQSPPALDHLAAGVVADGRGQRAERADPVPIPRPKPRPDVETLQKSPTGSRLAVPIPMGKPETR